MVRQKVGRSLCYILCKTILILQSRPSKISILQELNDVRKSAKTVLDINFHVIHVL